MNNEKLNYVPDQEFLSKGHDLYQQYCQDCHGADLNGNGPRANSLEVKPANLKEKSLHFTSTGIKGVMDFPHYSHETIEDQSRYGNDTMPPLKEILSRLEVKQLADYISVEIRSGN